MSLAPFPLSRPQPAARTAERRSRPTSATASRAGSLPRRFGLRFSTFCRPRRSHRRRARAGRVTLPGQVRGGWRVQPWERLLAASQLGAARAAVGAADVPIVGGCSIGHWVTQGKTPVSSPEDRRSQRRCAARRRRPYDCQHDARRTREASRERRAGQGKAPRKKPKKCRKRRRTKRTPPPKAVKLSAAKQKKLSTTTGKKHEEEVNALGDQPIETGGVMRHARANAPGRPAPPPG